MTKKIIDELIKDELKKGHSLSKIARDLSLPYWQLVQQYGPTATQAMPLPVSRPRDIRELGKPGFQDHVIAIKRCGTYWPDEFADVLKDARKKFNAGTHEMFQTVNSGWVIQYLAARRRPTHARRFFNA